MQSIRLTLKPLSVNALYIGRKIKSKKARQFEKDIATLLLVNARDTSLPEGDLTIHYRFGTTRRQDTDNNMKLITDCIARHYGINDRRFRAHTAVRVPVKTGEEFIMFTIVPFRNEDFPSLIAKEDNHEMV